MEWMKLDDSSVQKKWLSLSDQTLYNVQQDEIGTLHLTHPEWGNAYTKLTTMLIEEPVLRNCDLSLPV